MQEYPIGLHSRLIWILQRKFDLFSTQETVKIGERIWTQESYLRDLEDMDRATQELREESC